VNVTFRPEMSMMDSTWSMIFRFVRFVRFVAAVFTPASLM
jgi:hypothetical protein